MSGVKGRITNDSNDSKNIEIEGFNGQISLVDKVGINSDGKKEYFVSNMPKDLVLLCANQYAKDGAIILMKNDGFVIHLSDSEVEEFRNLLKKYFIFKKLAVVNRTYEVCSDEENSSNIIGYDTAYHVGATLFHTRVNVPNMEQRILILMMMGFSYADIYQHVLNREKKKNSINGFPPDLTLAGLEKYKHKYGVTPTLVTLSQPHTINESEGLKDKIKSTEKPGDRIEIDCFEYEFNESRTKSTKHSKKLTSFGGAMSA